MEKRTRKIQILMTEEEIQSLYRILFWDQAKGSETRTISSLCRNILKEEIERRPEEDLKPINFKKNKK
jgi:hypothetical protein